MSSEQIGVSVVVTFGSTNDEYVVGMVLGFILGKDDGYTLDDGRVDGSSDGIDGTLLRIDDGLDEGNEVVGVDD